MFDQLVKIYCTMDDFCNASFLQWSALQLSARKAWECGLSKNELMIIVVLYHGSRYRYFKNYYNGVVLTLLKPAFLGLASYYYSVTNAEALDFTVDFSTRSEGKFQRRKSKTP
jgi:hypothetical protein